MIESLTPEQEALLDVYKEKWIKIGLSTKKTDPVKAMAAIKKVYAAANLVSPDKYELYDSPFEAIQEMKLRYGLDIKANDFTYGSQSASWQSFYNYFLEVVGLECCRPLEGLMELSMCCGWSLLFDELVVLTHPPMEIKFDEQKRTHCEDDYAIKYHDGTGIAIWHGTRIPSEWIFDNNTITPDVILNWKNVEERRSACEIIGWAQAIALMKGVVIDKDDDESIGTLMEVEIPEIGKEKFLLVLDPNTDKKVGLPVPPEMTTALEANSWTYGIDKFDFKPEFRT